MNKDLYVQIEKLRKKMILVGTSEGLTSERTIQLSKKLDYLINCEMNKQRKLA